MQPATTVEKTEIPEDRFSHMHVDNVRPVPHPHEGFTHLMTMTDRSTHWPEVILLRETMAETVLDTFVGMWAACFGVPPFLTIDLGVQFTSACEAHHHHHLLYSGQWHGGD